MRVLKLVPSVVALLALSVLAAGCATAPATAPDVERTELPHDLSGDWNDVDADLVASALIRDCLSDPWAKEWAAEHGRSPVVRLYPVRNRTDGYIDYRYFTKQLEAALVRSRGVDVVSSVEEAGAARAERSDQAEHSSDDSVKSHGAETGSDFILNGWILSQDDEAGGTRVRAYLTSLELVEVSSQKKAWLGQKRIRKIIRQP